MLNIDGYGSSRVYVDIETYSSVDLPKFGVYAYVESPDFMILMASWSVDGGPVETLLDEDAIRDRIREHVDSGAELVAHNAQFERVCFSTLLGMPPGEYLPPEQWRDTQMIAAELGLPQKLAPLGKALGGELKDEAGTRLINLFCKPNRDGRRTLPADRPMEWLDFIAYCEQDVVTLVDVDARLAEPHSDELATFHVDQRINDRGIRIDRRMAQAAVEVSTVNQALQKEAITLLSGIENPNSQPQMMAWIQEQGLDADNLQKETVDRLLSGPLTAEQRQVLTLRRELALVASKKYAAAIGAASGTGDGPRLRGTLRFFGAHTGRWSGRGVQLQNLPREQLETEDDTDAAIRALVEHGTADAHTLKALVRALFVGPFTVVDYSAIEARVIAWLAGETWALEAFRDGRDIYVETAERMGGLTRMQGKVAVLALGYAGGINALKNMAKDDETVRQLVTPPGTELPDGRELSPRQVDERLQNLVQQWRRANPRVVRLWRTLDERVSEPGRVGRHVRLTEGEDALGRRIELHLPSGRSIAYHDVRWERYAVPDPVTGRIVRKQGWRYADPKNPFNYKQRIGTYGGRLAENVTQAVARDILAAALVRLEEAGYRVVGHVHDEVIIEGRHDVDEVARIMSVTPSWAHGLPIDGEGFTCRRYRKD